MVNIPVINDILAVRIVATELHNSGWIDRIVLADFPLPTNSQCAPFFGCTRGNLSGLPVLKDYRHVNDEELKGVRGSVRYQPTEQLAITATAFYQSIAQDGLSYFDDPPGNLAHYQPFDIPEPFSDNFRMYNLEADLTLSPFTVTSATSYWTRSQAQTQDISETIQRIFDIPAYGTDDGGAGPVGITDIDYTKQLTEEIRLTSNGDTALQWLVAVYYERWSKVQQAILLGCGYPYIDNVGTADIRGGEIEVNFKLSPSWTFAQTGGYTHAVLTSTAEGTGLAVGSKLLNVPEYSFSTSIVYTRPIGLYDFIARASNEYVGSQTAQSYYVESLPGYDIANFRIGLAANQWSAFLFVNNLTNKQAELTSAQNYGANFPSLQRIATNQPRTTGVSLEYKY
jgi:outer membrane receptor protein involved in Fe transport